MFPEHVSRMENDIPITNNLKVSKVEFCPPRPREREKARSPYAFCEHSTPRSKKRRAAELLFYAGVSTRSRWTTTAIFVKIR